MLARDNGAVSVECAGLLTVLPTYTTLHPAASLAARLRMHAPHHGHASRRAAPSQRPEHDGIVAGVMDRPTHLATGAGRIAKAKRMAHHGAG